MAYGIYRQENQTNDHTIFTISFFAQPSLASAPSEAKVSQSRKHRPFLRSTRMYTRNGEIALFAIGQCAYQDEGLNALPLRYSSRSTSSPVAPISSLWWTVTRLLSAWNVRRRLCSLLPLAPYANERAQGTRQTDEPVIKVGPAQSRGRCSDVAKVSEELQLTDGALPTSQSWLAHDHSTRCSRLC